MNTNVQRKLNFIADFTDFFMCLAKMDPLCQKSYIRMTLYLPVIKPSHYFLNNALLIEPPTPTPKKTNTLMVALSLSSLWKENTHRSVLAAT